MPNVQENARPIDRIQPRGIHFPFSKRADGLPSADVPPETYISNIKQILLTQRGERVMRPTFGSSLRAFLFQGIDGITQETIDFDIRSAIGKFEPRVRVEAIKVSKNAELGQVNVKIVISSPQGTGLASIELEVE